MSYYQKILDLIIGRWKSQILYTGAKLGIFDHLTSEPKETLQIAKDLDLDDEMAYRLLRALASLGLLKENPKNRFSISQQGKLMRKDHLLILQGIVLLEEGPEHYQIWKHLPKIIKDGKQNGFLREYGSSAFEYAERNTTYGNTFNQAMSSYSNLNTQWVLEALATYDFSKIHYLCDIGGGHGHLLSHILKKYPHMKGKLLELESVIKNKEHLWPQKIGVGDRCSYIIGNMFKEVPYADAYIMKTVLHDWNDEECLKILSNIHRSSPNPARLYIVEHLVSDLKTSYFPEIFDIHMMCCLSGRERTAEEYLSLLQQSGWIYVKTFYPKKGFIGIIEARKFTEIANNTS